MNNAGRSQRGAWDKIKVAVDRAMLEVNVLGALSLTRAVLPHMMQNRRGHIVAVSSVAGKLGSSLITWVFSFVSLHDGEEKLNLIMLSCAAAKLCG